MLIQRHNCAVTTSTVLHIMRSAAPLFVAAVLVTFAFTSTDASCNSDFNFDSLIDTALDAGHQISATVPKHANKVAGWLKNKAKHPKLRAWIESIVADHTPPPKKADTATKATSASFTLGDWVEVQVLDKVLDIGRRARCVLSDPLENVRYGTLGYKTRHHLIG